MNNQSASNVSNKSKVADVACFVVGPVITILGLFSFEYDELINHYFYDRGAIFSIASGVGLLIFGILRWRWHRISESERKVKS